MVLFSTRLNLLDNMTASTSAKVPSRPYLAGMMIMFLPSELRPCQKRQRITEVGGRTEKSDATRPQIGCCRRRRSQDVDGQHAISF